MTRRPPGSPLFPCPRLFGSGGGGAGGARWAGRSASSAGTRRADPLPVLRRSRQRPVAVLPAMRAAAHGARLGARSEEHTSELQSLAYLVCRLLLEKKKKQSN